MVNDGAIPFSDTSNLLDLFLLKLYLREEGHSHGTAKPLRSPARPRLPGLLIRES